jgi:hypothetical protein
LTDDISPDTLREVRAAKVRGLSRDEKVPFLKANGWVRDRGNLWRARNGVIAPLAYACRLQLLAELEDV